MRVIKHSRLRLLRAAQGEKKRSPWTIASPLRRVDCSTGSDWLNTATWQPRVAADSYAWACRKQKSLLHQLRATSTSVRHAHEHVDKRETVFVVMHGLFWFQNAAALLVQMGTCRVCQRLWLTCESTKDNVVTFVGHVFPGLIFSIICDVLTGLGTPVIQTRKRFKRTPFIRTKHNGQFFGVVPFKKLRYDT